MTSVTIRKKKKKRDQNSTLPVAYAGSISSLATLFVYVSHPDYSIAEKLSPEAEGAELKIA